MLLRIEPLSTEGGLAWMTRPHIAVALQQAAAEQHPLDLFRRRGAVLRLPLSAAA